MSNTNKHNCPYVARGVRSYPELRPLVGASYPTTAALGFVLTYDFLRLSIAHLFAMCMCRIGIKTRY